MCYKDKVPFYLFFVWEINIDAGNDTVAFKMITSKFNQKSVTVSEPDPHSCAV